MNLNNHTALLCAALLRQHGAEAVALHEPYGWRVRVTVRLPGGERWAYTFGTLAGARAALATWRAYGQQAAAGAEIGRAA